MNKYTREYAESFFDAELNFLHNLLLITEVQKLGYNDTEEALKKCGFNDIFIKNIIENSHDIKRKLIEQKIPLNDNILNMEHEIQEAIEGNFDYISTMRIYPHKWKRLLFDYFNNTYVKSITEIKEKMIDL